MDSSDNVKLIWCPGLEIIRNKSGLLKSDLGHARCVRFVNVCRWGINHFSHWITQEMCIFTQRF